MLSQKPSDVIKRVLGQIKNLEGKGLKIFVEVLEEDVLVQAAESDARHKSGTSRGVFDGVPVAVKVCCYDYYDTYLL